MPDFPRLPALLSLSLAMLLPSPASAQDTASLIATPEDIQKEFEAVPCDDGQRLAAVRALFEKAGAPADAIKVESFGNVENLVVVKPGASSEKIVVGAHYDKVANGCGAVDNWTGQVAMTRLYRTLRDVSFGKTLVFVAFGREEDGLVGSRAMVKAIDPAQAAGYCAMVNIDSLGLGAPQVADNMSSPSLGKLAAELATGMEMPFHHAGISRANSDSSSFVAAGIPAVTIHGLSKTWPKILHGPRDQASKVNPESVYLGYRLALAMLARIDQAPCDAYR